MNHDNSEAPRRRQTPRRPYSPPGIRQEELFETVAAGCAKFSPLPPTSGGCGAGYKSTA